ncbi:MAG: hypothetical protein AABX82_02975 [Nanoarchaeota archaeon]
MKVDNTTKYMFGMVGVVLLVGLFVLFLNNGSSGSMTDLSGHATAVTCGDGTCARNEARTASCAADCTSTDTDGDGLYDYQETYGLYGSTPFTATDPNDADSDGDGLSDGEEVQTYNTKPKSSDSDSDGLTDYDEVTIYGTSPTSIDTDNDGYSDAVEISLGTDPNDASSHPMPDLILSGHSVTFSPGGVAYITSNGTVAYSNSTVNFSLIVQNIGTGAVGSKIYAKDGASLTFNGKVAAGSKQIISGTHYSSLSSGNSVTITDKESISGLVLHEIMTNGTASLTFNYTLDSYSYASKTSWYGVNESNEGNNNGTMSVALSSSGITFIPADCATNRDCASGCACTTRTDSPPFACMQTTTSGGSTYTTTTPC